MQFHIDPDEVPHYLTDDSEIWKQIARKLEPSSTGGLNFEEKYVLKKALNNLHELQAKYDEVVFGHGNNN